MTARFEKLSEGMVFIVDSDGQWNVEGVSLHNGDANNYFTFLSQKLKNRIEYQQQQRHIMDTDWLLERGAATIQQLLVDLEKPNSIFKGRVNDITIQRLEALLPETQRLAQEARRARQKTL